jgi:hypothetical protein
VAAHPFAKKKAKGWGTEDGRSTYDQLSR